MNTFAFTAPGGKTEENWSC